MAQLVLMTDGDLNLAMYQALNTALTLDEALDLLEIDEVGRSWRAAEQRNSDRLNDLIRKNRADSHR